MTSPDNPPSVTCPRCGAVSYNPNDVKHSYCGACHAFAADPLVSDGDPLSVYQYFKDGLYEEVATGLDAPAAVVRAKALITSVGGRIGTTARVVITDRSDCIVFEWQFGQGVLYPPPGYAP